MTTIVTTGPLHELRIDLEARVEVLDDELTKYGVLDPHSYWLRGRREGYLVTLGKIKELES